MKRVSEAIAPATLLILNALIVGRLFYTPYTVEMGSIEAAYISLAHYIRFHFSEFPFSASAWFPLWYGGIPFPDSYPPLMHFLDAAVAWVLRISPGLAYHLVCAFCYALTPSVFYWTARRLGAGIAGAFTGGLLYSLVSPSCFLVREIRVDALGWFGPRRIDDLAQYGEGPLQLSFLFLLLALGLIHLAIERRRPLYFFIAGAATAAVALTNWIGAFCLALALAAYLLSGLGGEGVSRWYAAAGTAVFAYALAMPWCTPSIIATIRANAPRLVGFHLSDAARWAAAAIVASILILAWLMARWRLRPNLRFALLFAMIAASIPLPAYWWKIEMLPQSQRYHVEMDLALCLAAALLVPASLRRLHAMVLVACLMAAAVPAAIHERAVGRRWTKPIDIRSTVQYEASTWLEKNLPGRRVFGPGSIGFWMDAFSDTPMLTGGFDNGVRNRFVGDVNYQIYYGDSQELALAFLKAYGVDAVVACEQGSREYFPVYRVPDKFKGLQELWRDGGDAIYAVPRGSASLAHAVTASDMVVLTPVAYNQVAMEPYLRALADPSLPAADFRWRSPGAALITANLHPEHLVSVQVAWDEGWHARVNGSDRRIWGDKLGQIAIAPECNGECAIDLIHEGTLIDHVAAVISPLAFAAGVVWVLLDLSRRRKSTARAVSRLM